jgi:hypothetical protein
VIDYVIVNLGLEPQFMGADGMTPMMLVVASADGPFAVHFVLVEAWGRMHVFSHRRLHLGSATCLKNASTLPTLDPSLFCSMAQGLCIHLNPIPEPRIYVLRLADTAFHFRVRVMDRS